MIVVSDTTAITSLLQVGQIKLMQQLFDEVLIPPSVYSELLAFHEELPVFVRVSSSVNTAEVENPESRLDQGEVEAIALAREMHADFLVIDERHGRQIADRLGLRCIGLVGVLLMAKNAGYIAELKKLLDQLEQVAGFYLSQHIKEKALAAAGE